MVDKVSKNYSTKDNEIQWFFYTCYNKNIIHTRKPVINYQIKHNIKICKSDGCYMYIVYTCMQNFVTSALLAKYVIKNEKNTDDCLTARLTDIDTFPSIPAAASSPTTNNVFE